MKNSIANKLRLCAGLLTVVLLVAHQYLPDKRITLVPNTHYPQSIYSASPTSETPTTEWIDKDQQHFRCWFLPEHEFPCGYSLSLGRTRVDGLDLEDYDHLHVHLAYQGKAERIRLYIRNYNAAYDRGDALHSSKFHATTINTSDLDKRLLIKLSEFSVGEWWIKDFNIPREHAAPEFSNIINMGIDFDHRGEHELQIKSIEFSGSWVQKESLYLALMIFWMSLILWESAHRFYPGKAHQRNSLSDPDKNNGHELGKSEFEVFSTTDTLTGALNRAGIQRTAERAFRHAHEKSNMGLLLLDIDHFKHINDLSGRDCGDRILKALVRFIAQNNRPRDVVGRWGGEEFVLLCFEISADQLLAFAEQLRLSISLEELDPQDSQQITVSMGVTMIKPDDSFANALARAEVALRDAKDQGRNQVIFNEG